ncbi:hypothetical protein DFJ73DRAFT_757726 [Zopfochytrium polystomum]|nr:hypothetical protein DFJ73DRAFT_757726 [Zopfochytrium polystomum]
MVCGDFDRAQHLTRLPSQVSALYTEHTRRKPISANISLERFLVVEGYKQRPTEHSENEKSMGQAQFPPQGIWQVGTAAAAARHRNCRNGTVRSQSGWHDPRSWFKGRNYSDKLTGSEVELAKILETPPHERRRPKAKDEWDRKYWSPVRDLNVVLPWCKYQRRQGKQWNPYRSVACAPKHWPSHVGAEEIAEILANLQVVCAPMMSRTRRPQEWEQCLDIPLRLLHSGSNIFNTSTGVNLAPSRSEHEAHPSSSAHSEPLVKKADQTTHQPLLALHPSTNGLIYWIRVLDHEGNHFFEHAITDKTFVDALADDCLEKQFNMDTQGGHGRTDLPSGVCPESTLYKCCCALKLVYDKSRFKEKPADCKDIQFSEDGKPTILSLRKLESAVFGYHFVDEEQRVTEIYQTVKKAQAHYLRSYPVGHPACPGAPGAPKRKADEAF